jgi:muramoyltetrapeptide carboxypeptidase
MFERSVLCFVIVILFIVSPCPCTSAEPVHDHVYAADQLPPEDWVKPRALRKGSTIMLVAPSGPAKRDQLLLYSGRLERMGFRVIKPENLFRTDHYLAGSDDERVEELNSAIRNPQIDAIFPCAGGFGLTRILDRIDYPSLRKNRPAIIGFSDVTALHLAIAREAKLITFHSPLPQHELWLDDREHEFATQSFWRCLLADRYEAHGQNGFSVCLPKNLPKPNKLVGGIARGRLLGGNLTLICATLGTPYAIHAKGAILFLEDTNEAPYRTDRALSQLRLAGVLKDVAGVVVGDFSRTDRAEVDRIVRDYFSRLGIPVITNFPVGHILNNVTLPHGAFVELDADRCVLSILENPVAVE